MSYVDGFLLAVPEANKEAYRRMSEDAWNKYFKPAGALEHHEAWEDDVPEGKVTSFPMAVKREAGEVVVFSWIVWPDKAKRDACYQTMMSDTQMPQDMPFDGKRMMYGGFTPLFEAHA